MTSPPSLLLLLLAVFLQPVTPQDLLLDSVPCQNCQRVSLSHYEAMDCKAVFNNTVSECCPASFDCLTEKERGIELNTCVYKNVTYKTGESVPIVDPCHAGCYCREAFSPEGPAKVECAVVECPSLFNDPKPGCRPIYSIDSCCSSDEECTEITTGAPAPEAAVTRTAGCESEGKEYLLGDKIYFDSEPCRHCVCTENFTDAFGPNCTSVDCGMDFRSRKELRDGCTPIYFSGSCCSIDWICPDSTKVKPTPEQLKLTEASAATHCTLGKIVAPRNAVLMTDDCNLNCICATPPAFTCVQYSSCDDAAVARKSGVLP